MIAPLHIVVLLKMVSTYNIGSSGVFIEQIDTFKIHFMINLKILITIPWEVGRIVIV